MLSVSTETDIEHPTVEDVEDVDVVVVVAVVLVVPVMTPDWMEEVRLPWQLDRDEPGLWLK